MIPLLNEELEQYAIRHTSSEPSYLAELEAFTHAEMEMPQMLTGKLEGRLLKMLVQISQARLVFEIGTFTGYSALSMAEGLPSDGKIITCEINPAAQKVAQRAIDASPFKNKIEIRMGPALETIKSIEQPIDLAFIDADKENYPKYYEEVLIRTRPGGLVVIDNMFWSGHVLNPQDEASRAVASVNSTLVSDSRVESLFLTIRDGIQLVRKRG